MTGQTLDLAVHHEHLHFFDSDTGRVLNGGARLEGAVR
jgi:hypothetical protein